MDTNTLPFYAFGLVLLAGAAVLVVLTGQLQRNIRAQQKLNRECRMHQANSPTYSVQQWMADQLLCALEHQPLDNTMEQERLVIEHWLNRVVLSGEPDGPVCTWSPSKGE